jgi:hypothetical protein
VGNNAQLCFYKQIHMYTIHKLVQKNVLNMADIMYNNIHLCMMPIKDQLSGLYRRFTLYTISLYKKNW